MTLQLGTRAELVRSQIGKMLTGLASAVVGWWIVDRYLGSEAGLLGLVLSTLALALFGLFSIGQEFASVELGRHELRVQRVNGKELSLSLSNIEEIVAGKKTIEIHSRGSKWQLKGVDGTEGELFLLSLVEAAGFVLWKETRSERRYATRRTA